MCFQEKSHVDQDEVEHVVHLQHAVDVFLQSWSASGCISDALCPTAACKDRRAGFPVLAVTALQLSIKGNLKKKAYLSPPFAVS